jgi:8-oxo-dGTP pyrophosphatase MutT (NUDIX family)
MSVPAEADGVPIRPAATLMLVDDRPDLEVLVLLRRKTSNFVGGMSVFPGGGVDAEDAAVEIETLADGLDEGTANQRLDIRGGALAHWMAVIRETFEEAGVLLARAPHQLEPVSLHDEGVRERFARHRNEVDAGRALLAEVLSAEGLRLATDLIHYTGRWITPPGPPRRYDTRFFIAKAPAGQVASADETEAVDAEWMRPGEALERFARGELLMLPPTVGMLRILSGFTSAEEAVVSAKLQQDTPDRQARVGGRGGHWRVLLPGDEDYDREEHDGSLAWVRLASPSLLRSKIQGPTATD